LVQNLSSSQLVFLINKSSSNLVFFKIIFFQNYYFFQNLAFFKISLICTKADSSGCLVDLDLTSREEENSFPFLGQEGCYLVEY
jgi:hypothetical protein